MSEWQPIETAPKDGTRFWAAQADAPEMGELFWYEGEFLAPSEDYRSPNWLPTHWMPLPHSPVSALDRRSSE